jgi:hypothetical protein
LGNAEGILDCPINDKSTSICFQQLTVLVMTGAFDDDHGRQHWLGDSTVSGARRPRAWALSSSLFFMVRAVSAHKYECTTQYSFQWMC